MPRIAFPPLPARHSRGVARACLGVLVAAGLAWPGSPRAAEPDSPPVPDSGAWTVRPHEGGDSVEIVTRDEAGAFGAICSEGSCLFFIEPNDGCEPGAVYPVMANSATIIALVESACRVVSESRSPGGTIRTLATMAPSQALMHAIADGERIALAFPQTAGNVDVVSVETGGMREALRNADAVAPAALEKSARGPGRGMRPAAAY